MQRSKPTWVFALRLLAVALLSAACASILGIETTKRSNRANQSYGAGYEGCRRGNCSECLTTAHTNGCHSAAGYGAGYDGCRDGDCGECLSDEHRCLCQGQSANCIQLGDGGVNPQICEAVNLNPCTACLCTSCDLARCTTDPQCNEVLSCVQRNSCDPSPSSANTCYADDFCKGVIDAADGPTGAVYAMMLDLVECSGVATCDCPFGAGSSPGTCEGGVQCDDGGTAPANEDCQPETGCEDCNTTGQFCRCNGGSVESCFPGVLGGQDCSDFFAANACNECACNSCTEPLFQCADELGCLIVAQCLRINGCEGSDCGDACDDVIAAHGGEQGRIYALATALMRCQNTATCPCGPPEGSRETITCGTRQCGPFTAGDSGTEALAACCFEQQGSLYCGYDVSAVLYGTCEPTGQTGKVNTADCPSIRMPEGFPYFGAFLEGCCRPTTAEVRDNGGIGACGYFDTTVGLRCVPPDTFDGVSTSPEGCTYTP